MELAQIGALLADLVLWLILVFCIMMLAVTVICWPSAVRQERERLARKLGIDEMEEE